MNSGAAAIFAILGLILQVTLINAAHKSPSAGTTGLPYIYPGTDGGRVSSKSYILSGSPSSSAFKLQSGLLWIDACDPDLKYNDKDKARNVMGAFGDPNTIV